MDAFAWIVVIIALLLAAAALVVWTRRSVPSTAGRRPEPTRRAPSGRDVSIMLDVGGAEPGTPSVTRMVEEVGNRVLATTPEAEQVTVTNRDGVTLGTVVRPSTPDEAGPALVDERPSAAPRHHRPDPTRTDRSRTPRPEGPDVEVVLEPRHLAERFDLPAAVIEELRDPEDPIELVRAIFVAAGLPARVDGDVVRSEDEVFIVVPEVHGRPAGEGLNRAFHRFKETGASSAVAISMGYASPREMRKREALEPALAHVGPSALQRMADAVALGADPRRFAVMPSVADNTSL